MRDSQQSLLLHDIVARGNQPADRRVLRLRTRSIVPPSHPPPGRSPGARGEGLQERRRVRRGGQGRRRGRSRGRQGRGRDQARPRPDRRDLLPHQPHRLARSRRLLFRGACCFVLCCLVVWLVCCVLLGCCCSCVLPVRCFFVCGWRTCTKRWNTERFLAAAAAAISFVIPCVLCRLACPSSRISQLPQKWPQIMRRNALVEFC